MSDYPMLKIIALSGFKGSGKDTVARIIKSTTEDCLNQPCKVRSMADPIRDIVKTLFHIEQPLYLDKEKELQNKRWLKRFRNTSSLYMCNSYRDLLNSVGESFKFDYGNKIWVWNMEDEIYKFAKENEEYLSYFIIPDIRYKPELDMLNNLRKTFNVEHWLVLRKSCLPEWAKLGLNVTNPVERKIIRRDFYPPIHESSWCFANPKFDRVIKNDGTLDELQRTVNTNYYLSLIK